MAKSKSEKKSRIDLRTITKISDVPMFSKIKETEKLLLVLHYFEATPDELVLKFKTQEEKRLWWQGVQFFILKAKASQSE